MEKLTYKEIQEKVGEAWALVTNIEHNDDSGHFSHATLLFFHKSKKRVYKEMKKTKHKNIGVFYMGKVADGQILILNL